MKITIENYKNDFVDFKELTLSCVSVKEGIEFLESIGIKDDDKVQIREVYTFADALDENKEIQESLTKYKNTKTDKVYVTVSTDDIAKIKKEFDSYDPKAVMDDDNYWDFLSSYLAGKYDKVSPNMNTPHEINGTNKFKQSTKNRIVGKPNGKDTQKVKNNQIDKNGYINLSLSNLRGEYNPQVNGYNALDGLHAVTKKAMEENRNKRKYTRASLFGESNHPINVDAINDFKLSDNFLKNDMNLLQCDLVHIIKYADVVLGTYKYKESLKTIDSKIKNGGDPVLYDAIKTDTYYKLYTIYSPLIKQDKHIIIKTICNFVNNNRHISDDSILPLINKYFDTVGIGGLKYVFDLTDKLVFINGTETEDKLNHILDKIIEKIS